MQVDDVMEAILSFSGRRFQIVRDGESVASMMALAEGDFDRGVCLVRRPGASGHRTVLVARGGEGHLELANRWVAEVRDHLPEPLTADLFLFFASDGMAAEDTNREEGLELYCRRFVSRPDEGADELVRRSSLGPVGGLHEAAPMEEPLSAALRETSSSRGWLTESLQAEWRSILLSERDGGDKADRLIASAGDQG